jgi:hypothetical protein
VLFGPGFPNLIEDVHGFTDILLIGHPDHHHGAHPLPVGVAEGANLTVGYHP